MTLYLDCEFNGFHGELISLALASTTGKHWYNARELPKSIDPWVKEHVVPFIFRQPVDDHFFKQSLWEYLRTHQDEDIIADWPEDFGHLMHWLVEPNGIMPNLELHMNLIRSGELKPDIPHNALSDAIALMQWHISK